MAAQLISTVIGSGILGGLISLVVTIGIYKYKVDNLKENLSTLEDDVKDFRERIVTCETKLNERKDEPVTKTESPVQLTEHGENLIEESKGRQFVEENYEKLKQKVEEKDGNTAYDIQENSKQVIKEMKDDDKFDPIKEYLFEEGEDIEDVVVAMGIHLRNKILEEKNIAKGKIDECEKK